MHNSTKTIVDIIKHGNLELFHSSMMAWLFDSSGEHGLRNKVLMGIAKRLKQNGRPELLRALSKGSESIRTELRRGNHRYDICVNIGDIDIVFENKTKTVGNKSQLERYSTPSVLLVALGLCDESYTPDVQTEYPVITYADVLSTLDCSKINSKSSDPFQTLVSQYAQFLKRELHIIELTRNIIVDPQKACRQKLAMLLDQPIYRENDRRFLNLIVLDRCRRLLDEHEMWQGTSWTTNKNDRSGVWLAGDMLPQHRINSMLLDCADAFDASIWFHVELWPDALLSNDDDDAIGMLQLRAWTETNNKDFVEAFWTKYANDKFVFRPKSVKSNANTFFVAGKHINYRDLVGNGIPLSLTKFARTFQ